ncbi:MAG: hypothetical protein GF398_11600 [Chitinivibrionales bacterium]|nr:hypothetical protein [Chitinivibrionales bacterium]
MRSEALDITIESRSGAIWLILSGQFHNEQVPNIKQEVLGFIQDGNLEIIIDMQRVTLVDTQVVPVFLELLNIIRGKNRELKFVFNNEIVSRAFALYRHLFSIFPDATLLGRRGLVNAVVRRSKVLFRRTGIRISRPVAVVLLVALCGLFSSLAYIIHLQNLRIDEQHKELYELRQWKVTSQKKLEELQSRLRPIEQLGLLPDTSSSR